MIYFKPAGMPLTSKQTVLDVARANPHGFGYVVDGETCCKTLNLESFVRAVTQVEDQRTLLVHCRWATTGTVKTSNCHPFYDPVSGYYFAHNGVLPFCPSNDITDSEFFFRKVLVFILRKYSDPFSALNKVAGKSVGSRLILCKKDKLYFYGNWYLTKTGLWSKPVIGGVPIGDYSHWWKFEDLTDVAFTA